MESNPFFSVIVPSHNGAEHIRKLMDSIESQFFTDYELIVVCDACNDGTEAIAEAYGAKVLSVDFHRDGLTRNAGLDIATGEWILFADDDDWFLHDCVFHLLHEKLGTYGEDMFNFSYVHKGSGYGEQTPYKLFIPCWCRCCKREFIGDTRFTDAPYGSDQTFFMNLLNKKPNMVFWNHPLYYYNANDRSLNEYLRMRGDQQ